MKWRRIIFGIIIIICIVAVNYGVYWTISESSLEEPEVPEEKVDLEKISSEFKNIFDNAIDYQNYTITNVSKVDTDKELVYTKLANNQNVEGKYEFNVNIPVINISKPSIETINEEIQNIFYSRVNSIMSDQSTIGEIVEGENTQNKKINTTIYEVKYKAYINSNILSLVIKANLKEGINGQRTLLKTYNINLTTYEQIHINQLKEIKGLNTQGINKGISEIVRNANTQAQNLQSLGYKVYIRDEKSDIYNIEKTTNIDCFLGKNEMLYVIYPYGNRDNTTEMDIIVFQ